MSVELQECFKYFYTMCEVWPEGEKTQEFLTTLDFKLIPQVVKELRIAVKETWGARSDLACFQEEILHVIEITPKYELIKLLPVFEEDRLPKLESLL